MADRGVLIVAWPWPEDLASIMPSEWLRLYERRFVPPMLLVKSPLRHAHSNENHSKRRRGQETRITYVSLEGLTESEIDFCLQHSTTCELSMSADMRKASFLWLAGARLPEPCRGQSGPLEYMLDEAKGILDCVFFSGASVALAALAEHLGRGTKERRRLARVMDEMDAVVESFHCGDLEEGMGQLVFFPDGTVRCRLVVEIVFTFF